MSTEVARQFNEIFKLHHLPENKEKKRLLKKRKKNLEKIKKDIL